MNIWMCGIPGSKWSGIDIKMRECINSDRTDETPGRLFFHSKADPSKDWNGHRGSYWGPGMGCGERWDNMSSLFKEIIQNEIDNIFTGQGIRVIKGHVFARNRNLDYIQQNFPSDIIFLIYRDPVASFEWWNEIMDWTTSYPDYNKMYRPETMRNQLIVESHYILDFAMRNKIDLNKYDPRNSFNRLPTYDITKAKVLGGQDHSDVYVGYKKI